MALRLLSRVRGTLPQGRSLPDEVWRGRHRAILLVLWLHVPALALLAVLVGDGLDKASGVVVVAASAALATAPWGGRRWRSALATVGLLSASCVLVGMSGGTVELGFHFFVTIALVMLYQDGFPFLIAVGFVAVYALVSAGLEVVGVCRRRDLVQPGLRAAVGELLLLASATANLANWRLNEDTGPRPSAPSASCTRASGRLSEAPAVPAPQGRALQTSSPTSCGPRSPASSGSASSCSPATTG